jgi:hypothetical protein
MSIDQTLHSLFGASTVAADVLVQEYGRYFGLATGVFRGGCLTGAQPLRPPADEQRDQRRQAAPDHEPQRRAQLVADAHYRFS